MKKSLFFIFFLISGFVISHAQNINFANDNIKKPTKLYIQGDENKLNNILNSKNTLLKSLSNSSNFQNLNKNFKLEYKTLNNSVNNFSNKSIDNRNYLEVIIPDEFKNEKENIKNKILKLDNSLIIYNEPQRRYNDFPISTTTPNDYLYNHKQITNGHYSNWGNDQWGLGSIQIEKAWKYNTGSTSTIVAVFDTGVDIFHSDFWENIDRDCPKESFTNNTRSFANYNPANLCDFTKSNIWVNSGEYGTTTLHYVDGICETGIDIYYKQRNDCDDDNNGYIDDVFGDSDTINNFNISDPNGHGTFISGIIGAKTNNITGMAGIAPNIKIMVIKDGSISGGLDYAIRMGADVLNGSWVITDENNNGVFDTLVRDRLLTLNNKGTILVFASGNENVDLENKLATTTYTNNIISNVYPVYPALDENVITIGAISPSESVSSFSNFGSKIDVVAPGNNIVSLKATNTISSNTHFINSESGGHAYTMGAGTSYSAPHIVGIAALAKSINKNINNEQFRQLLRSYSGTTTGAFKSLSVCEIVNNKKFNKCSGYGKAIAGDIIDRIYLDNLWQDNILAPKINNINFKDTINQNNSKINGKITGSNIDKIKIKIGQGSLNDNSNLWQDIFVKDNLSSQDISNLQSSSTLFNLNLNGVATGTYTIRLEAENEYGVFQYSVYDVYIQGLPVVSSSISGNISYFSSTSIPILGAQISLTNTDNNTLVSTTTTNNTGTYTFNNVSTGGNYKLSATYTTSSSTTGININDNVRNAQIIVGTYTPTDDAKISADTNQDGIININDNVRNAQIIVGTYALPIPFIFIPTDKTNLNATSTENGITKKNYLWPSYQSKTINNLNSNQIINFKGYKIGDTNGDWK